MPPADDSETSGSGLIRVHLAAERTVLANERTLLAYVRTALTAFIAGVTFIRFFDTLIIEIVGWIFLPVSLVLFLVGIWRYRKMKRDIGSEVAHDGCDDSSPPGKP